MEQLKHLHFVEGHDDLMLVKEPQALAVDLMVGKNRWLIKIRWIYTFFILTFFVIHNYLSVTSAISLRALLWILGLSIMGNCLFILALKRGLRFPSEKKDQNLYASLAILQLDFDLLVLSLLVYFSNGFDSPIRVLFVFYIVIATFLNHHKKAIRNTVTAIVLITVIYFSGTNLQISSERLTTLMGFNIILIFAFFISAYLSRKLRENEERIHHLLHKTRELSVTDGLTSLFNQTHFFLLLKLQLEKCKRYHSTFSLIIFDVDHFKNYNDNNGHLKGSEALSRVGELMRTVFRSSDIMAKYGGDEFVVILPNSDRVGTFLAADRMREVVEEEEFDGRENQPLGKITLSMGISSFPEHGETVEDLLDCADKALYEAKKSGRNKSVIYSPDIEEQQ